MLSNNSPELRVVLSLAQARLRRLTRRRTPNPRQPLRLGYSLLLWAVLTAAMLGLYEWMKG
jgi:hypothetical protein